MLWTSLYLVLYGFVEVDAKVTFNWNVHFKTISHLIPD